MVSRPGNGPRLAVHVHHFPNRNAITDNICLAARGCVAETDAGEFLLQGFLLQIKAAQGGDFQMPPASLPAEQRRRVFFDPTRLDNCCHGESIVYAVNGVKRNSILPFLHSSTLPFFHPTDYAEQRPKWSPAV